MLDHFGQTPKPTEVSNQAFRDGSTDSNSMGDCAPKKRTTDKDSILRSTGKRNTAQPRNVEGQWPNLGVCDMRRIEGRTFVS